MFVQMRCQALYRLGKILQDLCWNSKKHIWTPHNTERFLRDKVDAMGMMCMSCKEIEHIEQRILYQTRKGAFEGKEEREDFQQSGGKWGHVRICKANPQ